MKIIFIIIIFFSLFGFANNDKPNVLMIVFDDLNDFISPMGGHSQSKTPHFKALAKESIVFSNEPNYWIALGYRKFD